MPARPNGETLIARTARELSRLSLESQEGAFLGPEDELLSRLGVSRPTLRQAAKIVENDRLIAVRRGIKGGIYVTRPEADDAVRTLARFLRLQGATIHDVIVVNRLVSEEAADLAARCTDEGLRARLAAFTDVTDEHDTPKSVIRAEIEFADLISQMSGNATIRLVMSIGYAFGMEDHGLVIFRDPEQRAVARKLQRDLARAILGHDGEIARVLMRRRSATMGRWLEQNA